MGIKIACHQTRIFGILLVGYVEHNRESNNLLLDERKVRISTGLPVLNCKNHDKVGNTDF